MPEGVSTAELGLDQKALALPQDQFSESEPINTEPRSSVLLARLDQLVADDPDKYTPEARSNVWQFIHQIKIQEAKPSIQLKWSKYLNTLDDFKLFFELNSEWQGLSTEQINNSVSPESRQFYRAFLRFTNTHREEELISHPDLEAEIKEEREKIRQEIFPSKTNSWSKFTTLSQWKEYMIEQGWERLSTDKNNLAKYPGAWAFYSAFRKFIDKYRADDLKANPDLITEIDEERERMRRELFPLKVKEWRKFTTLSQWKEYAIDQGWDGLLTNQILTISPNEGFAFYSAFRKFISKYRAEELRDHPELKDEIETEREKMRQEIFPTLEKTYYSKFTTFQQWRDYMQKQGWEGLNAGEIQKPEVKGGQSFYNSFRFFINNYRAEELRDHPELKDEIEAERKKMGKELFPPKRKSWRTFATLGHWKEYMIEQGWYGLSAEELTQPEIKGGSAFYAAFINFVNNHRQTSNTDFDKSEELSFDIERMKRELFPIRPSKYDYTFGEKHLTFDSKPERLVAMILNKYGLLNEPQEGKNIHVMINNDRKNSFDFYTNGVFIEYHPVQYYEKTEGYDLSNVLDERIGHVTRPEYKGKPVYHIWDLKQLYDIIIDPVLNPNLDPNNIPTEEEFRKSIAEAQELARQYDLNSAKEYQEEQDEEDLAIAA